MHHMTKRARAPAHTLIERVSTALRVQWLRLHQLNKWLLNHHPSHLPINTNMICYKAAVDMGWGKYLHYICNTSDIWNVSFSTWYSYPCPPIALILRDFLVDRLSHQPLWWLSLEELPSFRTFVAGWGSKYLPLTCFCLSSKPPWGSHIFTAWKHGKPYAFCAPPEFLREIVG